MMPPPLKRALKRVPLAMSANALVKAWLVERDADAIERRSLAQMARLGIPLPEGEAFDRALTERLARRPQRLGWPKAMGDLHIFLAFGLSNWEAILPHALSAFGPVSTFEWRSHGYDNADPDWVVQRERMNRDMLAAFHAANGRRPVDVVVAYLSGQTVSPEVLREMAATGAVIVNFCFDDKIAFPGPLLGGRHASTASIAHAVDLNLTSDPRPPARYAIYGGLAMFHPEAASPDEHFPHDTPFLYDVSFIGAKYGSRPRFIRALERFGVKVECFGRGWPNGPVRTEDMPRIYSASRINLGFGGIGYSDRLMCLKGRDFEVPMSGGLYLTQHNPELARVYELGSEIATYRSVEECAELIRGLLADPDRAAAIRAAGHKRARRDHTYLARWTSVFEALGALPKRAT